MTQSEIIRTIEPEDWKNLQNLLITLSHEDPPVALELEPLVLKTDEWIKRFPKDEQGIFMVAVSKKTSDKETHDIENPHGEVIGFCYLVVPKFYKPIAYIGIAICKEYRRKDLGSRMFFHVAEWAASNHLQYIIADVWSWNEGSIKFFQRLGFKETSRFQDKFKGKQREKIRLTRKL